MNIPWNKLFKSTPEALWVFVEQAGTAIAGLVGIKLLTHVLAPSEFGRLARRTRNGSRLEKMLQYSLWLWRDLYNWTRVHYSLLDLTPAMALGLTSEVWSVLKYVLHPVHVS